MERERERESTMGIMISKCYTKNYESPMQLKTRIRVLEGDIKEMSNVREREARAFEERKKAFESKEEEWKRDRLKRQVAEQHWMGNGYLVEHMKEEQAKREVTVEKWKQLYLTIKTELDDLIHRTRQGGRVYFGAEEGMIEGLRRELKAKEETVEALRLHLATMEKEGAKREREIDILRQSLRILNSTKRNGTRKHLRRRLAS